MIFYTSGVRSLPRRPIFLADDCLQNIGNTSDILILISKSVSDLKFRHRNLLIILLLQRVSFIKCGEYSFGQNTVAILGTLIWPGAWSIFLCVAAASDKVYQLLSHGRWFSPGTPASSTTKSSRHDTAEILLKVALSTINQIKSNQIFLCGNSYA